MRFWIILALLAAAGISVAQAESRTWTNLNGETIIATMKGSRDGHVLLQTRTGRQFRYPLESLVEKDRDYVANWEPAPRDKAPTSGSGIALADSRIAGLVQGKLVRPKSSGGNFTRVVLDASDSPPYYAFYFSAHWCPPCRAFTPKLVQFYNQMQSNGADFEIIFVSADRSESEMYRYMTEVGMQFPALQYQQARSSREIMEYAGPGIPCLVFMDHTGKVLSDSYVSGRYVGPQKVLRDMEKVLKRETARSI